VKIIANVQGTCAIRASPDDIAPPKGILWSDVIAKISAIYKFAGIPGIQPGIIPQIPLAFQSGEFQSEQEKIAIQNLFLTNSGVAVQTLTTEQSEIVLENLIALLDDSFGFRIRASSYKRDYVSHIVVQFEKSIESCVAALETINALVRNAMSIPVAEPFSLKRLAFGKEVFAQPNAAIQTLLGLDAVDRIDFTIERRVNHPFSDNRYYVAAPIRTQELLHTLEEIEKTLA